MIDVFPYYTNYSGSPYAHWDYSLFEKFKDKSLLKSERFVYRGLADYLGNVRRYQESNTILLYKLVDYYKDLNKVLTRLLEGSYDRMFCKLAYGLNFFRHEKAFIEYLQIWDDMFSFALERYMKERHNQYDETYGIGYTTYFDVWFSYCLFYESLQALYLHNKVHKKSYEGIWVSRDIDVSSLTDSSIRLEWILPEYPLENYYQELIYQSFSP